VGWVSRITFKGVSWLRQMIERQYRVQLQLEQLPLLTRFPRGSCVERGYPVGFKAPHAEDVRLDEFYLYNHLKFTITYNDYESTHGNFRIIGFDVRPVSFAHDAAKISDGALLDTCRGQDLDDNPARPTFQALLRERYLELLHAKQNLRTNAAATMPAHCAMPTTLALGFSSVRTRNDVGQIQ
jgi:Endomembrane protein 70